MKRVSCWFSPPQAQPACPEWPQFPPLRNDRLFAPRDVEVEDDIPDGLAFSAAYDDEDRQWFVCIDESYASAQDLGSAINHAWRARVDADI